MDTQDLTKATYDTTGVPTIYANNANVTISFSDLRLYLAEVAPKNIVLNPDPANPSPSDFVVSPKLSVVLTPEFAKSLGDAILTAVAKYEAIFGPLRPVKTQEQFLAAIQQIKK